MMTNIDQFHEWVETQSPMALREYTFAQAAWVEQAIRIAELETKLAIAIEALEIFNSTLGEGNVAMKALTKIKGE
jgi:hypothetical protein